MKKTLFPGSGSFRIKKNIFVIAAFFFAAVLVMQLIAVILTLTLTDKAHKEQRKNSMSAYVHQAAVDIGRDMDRLDEMSKLVYEESRLYFEKPEKTSMTQVSKSEFNSVIDMIFRINSDVSGISLYRPGGGMLSYTNPHSPYYFLSGTSSLYEQILSENPGNEVMWPNKVDNQGQSMLAVRYFPPVAGQSEPAAVILEMNWSSIKDYFEKLGLLERGSVILLNEQGEILMALRSSSTTGDVNLVQNGKLNGKLIGESGMVGIEEYGEQRHVFYNSSMGRNCKLLYIADTAYLAENRSSAVTVLVIVWAVLLLLSMLTILPFRHYVVRPLGNIENALHAIVSGDKELQVQEMETGDNLYPLYDDLYALTNRLQNLINSEYRATVREKQAEIDALQSHINPHFLYNTLESIRGQAVEENVLEIEEMIKSLEDIFRYSITNKNAMVSLQEELHNIDNYLKIQQYRFSGKIHVEKQIAPESELCLVPKLLIQPLVENAIIHGLETKEGTGTIFIQTRTTQDSLIINIRDDGKGISVERLEQINELLAHGNQGRENKEPKIGMALSNINERIRMIFGEAYGLTIFSGQELGTNAEIRLPRISQ